MGGRFDYEAALRKAEAERAKLEAEKFALDAIRKHEEDERKRREESVTWPFSEKLSSALPKEGMALNTAAVFPGNIPVTAGILGIPPSESVSPPVESSFDMPSRPSRLGKGLMVKTAFSSYVLGSQIGQGGNARVFEAVDEEKHSVAIKFLDKTSQLKRFENEIRFCEQERHPNIVRILGDGVETLADGDHPFCVMPLYSQSLRKRMDAGLSPKQAIRIFIGLLHGLKEAHGKGIVHRDLKPENILFAPEDDNPVIADFGIADFPPELMATQVVTTKDARMANRFYGAPEQMRGGDVGPQADMFALGLILNEMFTGAIPHAFGFTTIGSVKPEYSYLDTIFEGLFQQDPARRLFPAQNVLQELERGAIGANDSETIACIRKFDQSDEEHETTVSGKVHFGSDSVALFVTSLDSLKRRMLADGTEKPLRRKLFSESRERFVSALSVSMSGNALSSSPVERIERLWPIRDLCLEMLSGLLDLDAIDITETRDFVVEIYNQIPPLGLSICSDEATCHLDYFFWDMCVSLTSYLLSARRYRDLRDFILPTYFLRKTWISQSENEAVDYTWFQTSLQFYVGRARRNATGFERPESILVRHELDPHWKASSLCRADLFLSQIGEFYNRDRGKVHIWYPLSAGMSRYDSGRFWNQLVSRKACERLFPLLDVSSIQTLKDALRRTAAASIENGWCKRGADIGGIARIVDEIDIDEVGSMP